MQQMSDNEDSSFNNSCDEGIGRALMKREKEVIENPNRVFKQENEINYTDLIMEDKLSEGGYGIVYRGKWNETTVAIKQIKMDIVQQDKLEEFKTEINVMSVIRHPNIVMFLGACTESPNLCIVLEYCSRGSLWNCLHKKEIKMQWEFRKRLALDIARGVLYLHA